VANDPTAAEPGTELQDMPSSAYSSSPSINRLRSSEIFYRKTANTSAAQSTARSLSLPQGDRSVTQKPVPELFTTCWMLLCIPQKSTVFIYHLVLSRRLTDQQLFRALRRVYEMKRPPWLLKFRLRAVTKINIIHAKQSSSVSFWCSLTKSSSRAMRLIRV
jgi:hypothetical protein